MATSLDDSVRQIVAHAHANAPAIRTRFAQAGLSPDDVQSVADLVKIPILPKDDVIAMQQADPPFGGLLAVPMSEVRHVFMSPGPLYEPDAGADEAQMATVKLVLQRIGFGSGDVVLNTLSYHLVPVGLTFDRALTELGCTVLPTGVGNTALQVKFMADFGVTGYVGTPSFLLNLIKKTAAGGADFKADFALSKALVTAEPLPPPLRDTLVNTYGITLGNAYGTAELGFLALNMDGGMAMQLLPGPIIEILDPETGQPVGPGDVGEVVVTNFNRAYPLIRLGTGDMAVNTDPNPGQSTQEERAITLVGRSGEARKVRGMFVHPNQVRFVVGQVVQGAGLQVAGVQGIVSREGDRDRFVVRVALADDGAQAAALTEPLHQGIQQFCRVRADDIEFVPAAAIPDDAPGMVDERDFA